MSIKHKYLSAKCLILFDEFSVSNLRSFDIYINGRNFNNNKIQGNLGAIKSLNTDKDYLISCE